MGLAFIVGTVFGGIFVGVWVYYRTMMICYKRQISDLKASQLELTRQYRLGRDKGYDEGYKAGKLGINEENSGFLI